MPEKKANPKLSVIIVNRNTSDLLTRCISKVLESDIDKIPQIIVVDNGSTDDSVRLTRGLYPEFGLRSGEQPRFFDERRRICIIA